MRRARLFLFLVALTLLPQALAAGRLVSWLQRSRALGGPGLPEPHLWVPALLVLVNLPMGLEIARRKRQPLLPRAAAAAVYQAWTAWWLGSFLYALGVGFLSLGAAPLHLAGLHVPTPPDWLSAAPFALAAYGALLGSSLLQGERVVVPVDGLPEGLRGLRVVQLSDLHSGRHISRHRLHRIARRAARLQPDLVVVTGDIVHNSPRFARQAAEAIAAIPARLGAYACLGNHDFWAGADAVEAELRRAGVQVLRNRGVLLRAPGAGEGLWLCGVDDVWSSRFDLAAALRDRPHGAATVLLSHQPNTWPLAQAAGVQLQLSGHTHGGQIALRWLHRSLSLARLITPFVAGLYQHGQSYLYVSRGAGSVIPMVRLGARPEVTLLTLEPSGAPASEPEPTLQQT